MRSRLLLVLLVLLVAAVAVAKEQGALQPGKGPSDAAAAGSKGKNSSAGNGTDTQTAAAADTTAADDAELAKLAKGEWGEKKQQGGAGGGGNSTSSSATSSSSNSSSSSSSSASPSSDLSWTRFVSVGPSKREGHTVSAVGDQLVVFGGCYMGRVCYGDLWGFDTAANEWYRPVQRGERPSPRGRHTMTLVGNNTLYLVGGQSAHNQIYRRDVFALDVSSYTWRQLSCRGIKPLGRSGHSAVAYKGHVLVFGGYTLEAEYMNDVFLLDVDKKLWTRPTVFGEAPTPRSGHAAAVLGSTMFVYGGHSDLGEFGDLHVLNLDTYRWHRPLTKGSMPSARSRAAAIAFGDQYILVTGGCSYAKSTCYNDTHVLDARTSEWSQLSIDVPKPPKKPAAGGNATASNSSASSNSSSTPAAAPSKAEGSSGGGGGEGGGGSGKKEGGGASKARAFPVMPVSAEAKTSEQAKYYLTPREGLAGDYVERSGQLFVFGGCYMHKNCSFDLEALKLPKGWVMPPDPWPIDNAIAARNPTDPNAPEPSTGLPSVPPTVELPADQKEKKNATATTAKTTTTNSTTNTSSSSAFLEETTGAKLLDFTIEAPRNAEDQKVSPPPSPKKDDKGQFEGSTSATRSGTVDKAVKHEPKTDSEKIIKSSLEGHKTGKTPPSEDDKNATKTPTAMSQPHYEKTPHADMAQKHEEDTQQQAPVAAAARTAAARTTRRAEGLQAASNELVHKLFIPVAVVLSLVFVCGAYVFCAQAKTDEDPAFV